MLAITSINGVDLENEPPRIRKCCRCGKPMGEGYIVGDYEYYCGDKCLKEKYSWLDYIELYEQDSAYWTTWEC